jgi:hypothetical protein
LLTHHRASLLATAVTGLLEEHVASWVVRAALGGAVLLMVALLGGCDTLDDGSGYGDTSSSPDSYGTSTSDSYSPSSSGGYDSQQQQQDQQNQDQIQLDSQAQDQRQSDQIQSDLYAQ